MKIYLQKISANFLKTPTRIKGAGVAVLFIITILGISSYFQLRNIPTKYSFDQFKPKSHPALTIDKRITKDFKLSRTQPYVILLNLRSNSKWTDPIQLQSLTSYVKRLKAINGVHKIINLATFQSIYTSDKDFSVSNVNQLIKTRGQSNWVYDDPFLSPNLITKDGKKTAIYIILESGISLADQESLMQQFKILAKGEFKDTDFQVGGVGAVNTQMTHLLGKELSIFLALSLFGAVLLLFLVFKGFNAVIINLIIGVIGNLLALGAMGIMGLPFTIFSTTLPILVTITTVAITTHSLVQLSHENFPTPIHFEFAERYQLLFNKFKSLLGPHLLTAITTSIGFSTLIFADIQVIKEYGISVSIGVLLACISSLIVLPALLIWVSPPHIRNWPFRPERISASIVTHKKPAFLILVMASIFLTILGQNLKWTAKMFDELPTSHSVRKTTEFINNEMGGIISLNLAIRTANGQPPLWDQPKNIHKLDQLQSKWKQYSEIGSLAGISDFIKPTFQNGELPNKTGELAETYFMYGMSDNNPLDSFVTDNFRSTRVAIRLKDVPAIQSLAIIKKLKAEAKASFPAAKVEVGGNGALTHSLSNEISKTLLIGFFHALVLIMILLTFVFKSFRWAIIAVIPNLIPPIVLLSALSILSIPIKPATALIFSISLGIAFDNTVYILGKLKGLLKPNHCINRLPIKQLLTEELRPCLVSSGALIAGFSVFLFSSFQANNILGALMLLSICAGLIGDLLLLPVTLCLFPRLLKSKYFLGEFNPERNDQFFNLKELFMASRTLVAILVPLLLITLSPNKANAIRHTAAQILPKLEKSSAPPNEVAKMKMIIQDEEGEKKERTIVVKRKNGKSKKTFVRLLSPSNLKGLSFLSVNNGNKDDQWLYLPSSQRTRRILGSNKKSRFLDSDLCYEDLRMETYKNFKNRVIKTIGSKHKVAVIESKLMPGKESSYTKMKTWISLKHYRVEKTEYYGDNDQLLKVMTFLNYKRYKKKYWRAKQVTVKDVKANRKTELKLLKVSFKPLNKGVFSLSALEDQ